MNENSDFEQKFDNWIQFKKAQLKSQGPIPYGPEVIEPEIGNQRYIDAITGTEMYIREESETSKSRNKTFIFSIDEIGSNFRQMFNDPNALVTRPRELYFKYKKQGRTFKFLIEFKYDMFRDFMGL